ncbi:hypothetical protein Glove_199g53 [Diversispora epigaea]|uniref:CCHC-type domain-containing protein n=1 Tax=Diversispora epigaea TaxID=1348612 RepID=A0A397IR71_9GLOM|nr:hypothetical protein Glove_199g53 [Diversispora epigaea]
MTAPATKDDFFTNLRNCWLESNGILTTCIDYIHSAPSNSILPTPQPQSQSQPLENKATEHLESIAMRLEYLDSASQNPDALENFIENELYKRLGHANYHLRKEPFDQVSGANTRVIKKVYATKKLTKVTYKCSNCRKIGHRKNNCPSLKGKRLKKVNYTYQSEPENSDQENESIVVLEDSDEEGFETEESVSDNEPNHVSMTNSIHIMSPNFSIHKDTNQNYNFVPYPNISEKLDNSIALNNAIKHLEIKIDKKNVHKLTGTVGDCQSIGTLHNVPITISTGRDPITVYEDISVIPTKKDQDENDISIMILGTKWQHCAGWDPIVKGEFVATHNERLLQFHFLLIRKKIHTM